MTIFGPDISSYQNGLDLSRLSAASFVIAKTTEGTYYTDSGYSGWRRQAAALGKPFIWYHFLSGEDAHAQVAHTLANVGDASLPGMLDVEPAGSFSPTLAQVIAYVDAADAAGLNLRLVYLPHWYWQQIGSPDLAPLADRGLRLVSSAYPGGSGTAAQLYPGDNAAGWQPYGGVTPLLYQYTNQAADGGQLVDMNAYRGTAAQLVALLGATPTPTGDTIVALTQQDIDAVAAAAAAAVLTHQVPRGGAQGGATNLGAVVSWSDQHVLDVLGAIAKIPAAPAVDVKALAAAVAALIPPPAVPAVDVAALAGALAPLLNAGASADSVALAVVAHLGAKLAG